MKIFELIDWKLNVSEETWGFPVFKKLLDRDKTKDKVKALNDLLFIYHFCDIRSDYSDIIDDDVRLKTIKKDLSFRRNWKMDPLISDAIDFYNKSPDSINKRLYKSSVISADAIAEYLRNTKELLLERDQYNKPVHDIIKIKGVLKDVPSIMKNLTQAYKEVVAEKNDSSNKKQGSQNFNVFEDGLEIE